MKWIDFRKIKPTEERGYLFVAKSKGWPKDGVKGLIHLCIGYWNGEYLDMDVSYWPDDENVEAEYWAEIQELPHGWKQD